LSGEIVEQCVVVSNAHSHGGEPLDPHSCKKESSDIYLESSSVRPEHLWKAMKNGAIPCSPKDNGGCGYEYLELKCIFPQNWISKLREKVKRLIKVHGLEDKPTVSAWCSSCFKSHDEIGSINENLRKAATREGSSDNYLYCPSASDVKYGDLEHFQGHWIKGEPVIVRNALELTSGLSWEPMVMWRAMRELTYHGSKHLNVKAIDCLDWCEVSHIVYFIKLVPNKLVSFGWVLSCFTSYIQQGRFFSRFVLLFDMEGNLKDLLCIYIPPPPLVLLPSCLA